MRVLILNQYFHPDIASTSQLLTELAEDLAREHEVTVVCGRPSYDPTEKVESHGVVSEEWLGRVRVLRTWSTSFGRTSMPGRLTNYGTYVVSSTFGAVRATRPDIVMAFTDPPVIAGAAAMVASARRLPFVYVVQDLFPQVGVALGRIRNRALIASMDRFNQGIRQRASAIVVVGRDMRSKLESLGASPGRLHLIPNWSDGSAIQPLNNPTRLRDELQLGNRFIVMHSGNVGLTQQLDVLLTTAELLRDEPDIHVLIAGEGATKPDLLRRAKQQQLTNVTFIGYRPKPELADSLGTGDIHVVGLRRELEGLIVPSKMYGIMAAGRPFIAATSPSSEPSLVAREAGCGLAIQPGDPHLLAETVLRARNDRPRLAEMGRRARQEFDNRYDRPIATARYRALLEEVAGLVAP